jgi:hypothetical protein
MKLEGLGPAGIEPLKTGLKDANAQVRFFCAESLAYLNDTSGVDVLGETAIQNPIFRVYCLAALAAMDQPASHMKLRKLMDEPEIELRYGAFNALRTLDPHDPFLGLVRVLEEPKPEVDDDEPSDSMAVAITSAARRRRASQDDPFGLYVVDSEGPPLIHVSRTRRSEIVVFGSRQQLLPPLVLDTGSIFLNASDNDDKIELSKIVPSKFGDSDIKVTSSLELADVVRKTAGLGATYPQIVAILEAAKRQKNLSGQLVVDAVPVSNKVYLEAVLGKDTTAKRDDSLKRASGESSKSGRRWLFGLFGRESDDSAKDASSDSSSKNASTKKATSTPSDKPGDLAIPGIESDPSTSESAKKGDVSVGDPTAKRDDAVQKAVADEPEGRRWRLFDVFRRDDEA